MPLCPGEYTLNTSQNVHPLPGMREKKKMVEEAGERYLEFF